MPWVRKYPHSKRTWVFGIIAGIAFGLLLGYGWWGSTAAVVEVVEKELNSTESHIADLENRVIRLEARLVSQEGGQAAGEKNRVDENLTNDAAQRTWIPVGNTKRPDTHR